MISKVLVVDDSLTDRTNLEGILSESGYQTKTACDGNEAIIAAQSYQPDVILMDVNMPEKDGFAATRELKATETTKEIPVIFITSKNQKADMAWGQMLGAKGYVGKPYTKEQVLSPIKEL